MPSPNFQANGTISICRFVKVDASYAGNRVIQTTATTDVPIGISQQGSKLAPLPGAASTAADTAGDPIQVYGIGEICLLQSTAAGWTAGDLLTSDASGQGVSAVASGGTGFFFGAIALETISGAALGRVQVLSPAKR